MEGFYLFNLDGFGRWDSIKQQQFDNQHKSEKNNSSFDWFLKGTTYTDHQPKTIDHQQLNAQSVIYLNHFDCNCV